MLQQLFWLAGVLLLLWFVALNPRADRVLCDAIGRLLAKTDGLGGRRPAQLLQLPDGHGVAQVLVPVGSALIGRSIGEFAGDEILVLGIEREEGAYLSLPDPKEMVRQADELFLYGRDGAAQALSRHESGGPNTKER